MFNTSTCITTDRAHVFECATTPLQFLAAAFVSLFTGPFLLLLFVLQPEFSRTVLTATEVIVRVFTRSTGIIPRRTVPHIRKRAPNLPLPNPVHRQTRFQRLPVEIIRDAGIFQQIEIHYVLPVILGKIAPNRLHTVVRSLPGVDPNFGTGRGVPFESRDEHIRSATCDHPVRRNARVIPVLVHQTGAFYQRVVVGASRTINHDDGVDVRVVLAQQLHPLFEIVVDDPCGDGVAALD
mmetsp:Transcript_26163/g.29317  ORF Transcript_26163/g.29317 Transcript_26163/m.29317 type:complete len:237 (+) Transcript_26163:87-797(+)